jgi:hypothetical protein
VAPLLLLFISAWTGEVEIQSLFDRLIAADNRGDVDAVLEC